MKTTLLIIGTFILVVLVAAGGFYGGMVYQTNQASQVRQEFMGARGITEGQFPGEMPPMGGQFQQDGSGSPGRGAAGQVKSIEGNVMTISTAQDVTTVNLSQDTQIEMTVSGEIADLQTGMRVMVIGETDGDGVVNASQITVLSENQSGIPFGQQPPDSPPDTGTEP
jgi:hypothetical protein